MQGNGRYERQTALPEVGTEGQERLSKARVLIVGVGGLGSPVALYLAAAGVGTLGLIDGDKVSLNNLQRQVLYTENQIGQPKAMCAAKKLQELNSNICVNAYCYRLDRSNARELVSQYDLVIDGCDNFATRYLLNDTCISLQIPYIYGAIRHLEGQVSVFCYGDNPRTYRELYPDETSMLDLPEDKAVMGITPAVTGSIEAGEALKILVGYGEPLIGRLWTIDLRTMQTHILYF